VVKNCVIDNETRIGPGAIVEGCSIGRRCNVAGAIRVRSCVMGDETTIGTYFTQFSLLGSGAMICPDAGILDFSFKGGVQVKIDGRNVNTGSRILGGCLGQNVFLGPGVRLMGGQEVPNGAVLVTSPRHLVRDADSKLPDDIWRMDPGRHARKDKPSDDDG
jgi:carbonic anhydrase/acetyltransferase-like protein (isoleucine patch superfamily)